MRVLYALQLINTKMGFAISEESDEILSKVRKHPSIGASVSYLCTMKNEARRWVTVKDARNLSGNSRQVQRLFSRDMRRRKSPRGVGFAKKLDFRPRFARSQY